MNNSFKKDFRKDLSKITVQNGFQTDVKAVATTGANYDLLKKFGSPIIALEQLPANFSHGTEKPNLTSEADFSITLIASTDRTDVLDDLENKLDVLSEDVLKLLQSDGLEIDKHSEVEEFNLLQYVVDPFNELARGMAYFTVRVKFKH